MGKDITPSLAGWDFEPDGVNVRIVEGDDGRDKLQLRIDLGLMQMELDGRPDGARPHGAESLLDWYEDRSRKGELEELESEDCTELMREGVQYYHRYLSAFHLQRYDIVARDTARNLRLFAFVKERAKHRRDQVEFDRFRPYVTMMNTRALGLQALAKDDHLVALDLIDKGIGSIRDFLQEYGQSDNEIECMELVFLLRWRREIESERPIGPVERLRHQLARAVALEDYEEAARVRDQIRRLTGESESAATDEAPRLA
ncbi:MAG: UvrB/UvrC motif-containing protein [Isosphaeraceae bacterium]|nr:UvrB/UvrC motif-containing protein [Isosphaeraceae bacterium]